METRAKLCKRDYDYDFDNCPKIPLYALKQRKEKTLKPKFSYSEITCTDNKPIACRFDLRYTTKIRIAQEASDEHDQEACPDGVASASTIASMPSLAASKSSPEAQKEQSAHLVESLIVGSEGQLPPDIAEHQAMSSQQGIAMASQQNQCSAQICQHMVMTSDQFPLKTADQNYFDQRISKGGGQGMSPKQMPLSGGQSGTIQQLSFHQLPTESEGLPSLPPEPPTPPIPLPVQFPMAKSNIPLFMDGITPLPKPQEPFPSLACTCNMQMPTPPDILSPPNMQQRPQENVSLTIRSQGQIPPGMALSMPQECKASSATNFQPTGSGMFQSAVTSGSPGQPETFSPPPLNESYGAQPLTGSGNFQPLATSSQNEEPKICCRKRSLGWCKKKEQNESEIDAGQVDDLQPTVSKDEKIQMKSSTILK